MVNLEMTTTARTMKVAMAPTAFTAVLRCQPFSFVRRWWRTMPDWERVKPVNTPTA
jgi:hypothetical protein